MPISVRFISALYGRERATRENLDYEVRTARSQKKNVFVMRRRVVTSRRTIRTCRNLEKFEVS